VNYPFIDTDVIIRLLTGDDPDKQRAAKALFERVAAGTLTITAPDTVIADAVYVLGSPRLYRLPREQVRALLLPLVRLPHFRLSNRRAMLRALNVYVSTSLDFSDALIIATMEHDGADRLYSYDKHFDRLSRIVRIEPPPVESPSS
jgi:predicted nucleic acid-binding protein